MLTVVDMYSIENFTENYCVQCRHTVKTVKCSIRKICIEVTVIRFCYTFADFRAKSSGFSEFRVNEMSV